MINAKVCYLLSSNKLTRLLLIQMFMDPKNTMYRNEAFDINEEGDPSSDRPLIVQFCANDPEKLLASAQVYSFLRIITFADSPGGRSRLL